jgi:excisionase family DNA binding protein
VLLGGSVEQRRGRRAAFTVERRQQDTTFALRDIASAMREVETAKHREQETPSRDQETEDSISKLLTVKQAAELFGVSDRTLFTLSAPRGPIPVIRIGKHSRRYDLEDLKRYADRMKDR